MKKKNLLWALAACLVFAGLTSCSDDDDNGGGGGGGNTPYVRFLVMNEGSLGQSNSTISGILSDDSVDRDIYKTYNNRNLGAVGQSITLYDNKYYISVTNSHKIEILNASTFKLEETITHEGSAFSPHTFVVFDNNKDLAFITDNGSNNVWLLNFDEDDMFGKIDVGMTTQHATLLKNKIYFIRSSYDDVTYESTVELCYIKIEDIEEYIEDISTPNATPVVPTVHVTPYEPVFHSQLVRDKEFKLWITTEDGILRIDPDDDEINQAFYFSGFPNATISGSYNARIAVNDTYNRIYFNVKKEVGGGELKDYIYSISVGVQLESLEETLENAIVFECTDVEELYNIGLSPTTEEVPSVFVMDAGNYYSNGKVVEYSMTGEKLNTYSVGVNPYAMHYILR